MKPDTSQDEDMTEEQQDAMLDREMEEHSRWWNTLSAEQQRSICVKRALRLCIRWRQSIKWLDIPVFREYLRRSQRRLVELRYVGVDGGRA